MLAAREATSWGGCPNGQSLLSAMLLCWAELAWRSGAGGVGQASLDEATASVDELSWKHFAPSIS